MINDILEDIGAFIAGRNAVYNTYFTGGIQIKDGQVVKFVDGEGQYHGLSDTNANYFYIRYVGDINASVPTDEEIACGETQYSIPLRFVSWVSGGDSDKIAKAITYDLQHYRIAAGLIYYDMDLLAINKISIEPEKIMKSETLQEEVVLPRLSLVMIDFTATVRTYFKEDCVDRDFCVNEC